MTSSPRTRAGRSAGPTGVRTGEAPLQQDGRHARLQLVRLLPEPVLVRHAGRVAARTAGRGLARRRDAVPGTALADALRRALRRPGRDLELGVRGSGPAR